MKLKQKTNTLCVLVSIDTCVAQLGSSMDVGHHHITGYIVCERDEMREISKCQFLDSNVLSTA